MKFYNVKKHLLTATSILLIGLVSCSKNTTEPPIPVTPPIKSLLLKAAIETDSGVVLSWNKINFTDKDVWSFEVVRAKDASFGVILSPWSGDYMWSVYNDSTTLDKAPAFSDKSYYRITAKLATGERLLSNSVELEFKNSMFVKGYKTIVSYHDTASNKVFISDSYSKKIRSVNYLTKESVETTVETEMFNGGFILGVTNGTANELYATSRLYGITNIFDRQTLTLKKTINAASVSYATKNGFVYAPSFGNINVMQVSDNRIIQTFSGFANNGDMMLLAVPNANTLIGFSLSIANKIKEFTLNADGTIQSVKEFTPPTTADGDNIYGHNVKIHPSNGTFVGGTKGSIYSLANFTFQNSLYTNSNPLFQPEYAFSPDGKYLAVSTSNVESSVVIYNLPSGTKKYSFDIPDCIVQSLSWKNNTVIAIANNRYTDYILGTVVLTKKIP